MSRLTFVRQGSILSGGLDGQIVSLKGRIAKMSVLGWLDVFWTVRLSLKHSCDKANMCFWPVLCRYW